jgi:hypothetical protein
MRTYAQRRSDGRANRALFTTFARRYELAGEMLDLSSDAFIMPVLENAGQLTLSAVHD